MDGQAQDRLSRHGLRSERVLSPCKGPGAFEQEVAALGAHARPHDNASGRSRGCRRTRCGRPISASRAARSR